MQGIILWKPLYYTSIVMFVLSLVLMPISMQWSIITILALITLWSRIPGIVHFVFNKLAMTDLFALIVAVHAGWFIGALFGVFGIMFARIFGPYEWFPYTLRASISVFVAAASVPLILSITGGLNVVTLFLFEIVAYIVYYLLVIMFWREELMLEIALLPAVILFDFALNAIIINRFGDAFTDLMANGFSSGWPFLIFSAVIMFFVFLSRNAEKIAAIFGIKNAQKPQ